MPVETPKPVEKKSVDTHYSENLHRYASGNRLYDWHMRVFRESIADLLASTEATSVLDAGCGEGIVTNFLAEQDPSLDVSGVDASAEAISYADHHFGERVDFRTGDIFALPYDDDAFDCVVCSEVLEHLDQPGLAMAELKRVSRRHVLITVPLEPYFKFFNDLGRLLGVSYDPGHVQFWRHAGFKTFIRQHLTAPEFATKHYYQLALGEI